MGGVRFMFLTHKYAAYECLIYSFIYTSSHIIAVSTRTFRDDVADHDKWSKELGCSRILHSEEVSWLNFQRNLNKIDANTHYHTLTLFLENPAESDISIAVTWLHIIHLFDNIGCQFDAWSLLISLIKILIGIRNKDFQHAFGYSHSLLFTIHFWSLSPILSNATCEITMLRSCAYLSYFLYLSGSICMLLLKLSGFWI